MLLSVLIAMIGSAVALAQAQRMRTSIGRASRMWMLGGATTLGMAIWSMHFIGMLALHTPIAIGYDLHLTLLSVVPAIASALLGFHVLRAPRISGRRIVFSGLLMGVGISTMHYTGMAAIRMSPPIGYDSTLVAASVLIAVLASIGALLMMYQGERVRIPQMARLALGGAIMGLAISGMHYISMRGLNIAPDSICLSYDSEVERDVLAMMVSLLSLAWFAGGMLLALTDQRLARRNALALERLELAHTALQERAEKQHLELTRSLRDANDQLQITLESSPDAVFIADDQSRILFANACAIRWTGYSGEELQALSMLDLVPVEWRERYREDFLSMSAGNRSWMREIRFVAKDGSKLALEMNAVKLPDGRIYFSCRDITARKNAERDLRIAAIAFESQEAMMITDNKDIILRVNRAFTEITGYQAEDVIGRTPAMLKSGRHGDDFYREMRGTLDAEGVWVGEIWDRRKNGDIYPKWLTIAAVRDAEGRISNYVGSFTDSSEHVRDQQRLAESERFTGATLDALTPHVAVLDTKGCITLTNRAWREFAELNGLSPDRIGEGVNYLSVCDQAAAEGVAEAAMAAECIRKLIAGQSDECSFEYPCHSPLEQRWFYFRATCFAVADRTFAVISHTDITERKQAKDKLKRANEELEERVAARTLDLQATFAALTTKEEEIRSIVDNIPDCVISIDEKGIIQSANPAVEKILGYGVADLIGRNVSMLMPERHREAHDGYLQRYCRTGEARVIGIGRELEAVHKNGTRITMDLSVSEYFVADKHFFTGILRDIRERQKTMRELEQARLDAEQANRAKSAFLATMSHEIRTPMNGVIGMVDVLHQTSLKGYQVEIVDTIRDSAYSLLGIIEDILDFSKIEAGRLEIEQRAHVDHRGGGASLQNAGPSGRQAGRRTHAVHRSGNTAPAAWRFAAAAPGADQPGQQRDQVFQRRSTARARCRCVRA